MNVPAQLRALAARPETAGTRGAASLLDVAEEMAIAGQTAWADMTLDQVNRIRRGFCLEALTEPASFGIS